MRIYPAIIIALFIPLLLSGAEWDSFDVKVTGTSLSIEKGSTNYRLSDVNGKSFEVNYSAVPDENTRKRVITLKDIFYGWERISATRMEFYFSEDGIYTNLQTQKIAYKGENLLPYLPAGMSFQDRKEGLHYRFRIVVENKSYMLDGVYTDEEALLLEIYNFIKTKENPEQAIRVQKSIEDRSDPGELLKHRLSIFAAGNYLMPTGKLAEIFSDGYGGMAGVTLHNTGLSLNDKTLFHLDFTLAAGYHHLTTKGGLQPEITSVIDSAYIIPLCLYARYNVDTFGIFTLSPVFGVGLNYNSIDYSEQQPTGVYEAVKVREWAPSLSAGFQVGYPVINDKLTLFSSAEYKWMFERYMTAQTFVIQLGVEYSFMVLDN
jgi:outer membrane protein W